MSDTIIKASGLSHSFDYPLYSDIDIVLQESESMAVVGRSGSGKSTLLHTLSTFLRPDSGRVELLGRDIYSLNNSKLEEIRRYDIGIIFQAHYLFKGMTGRENVEISTILADCKMDDKILEELEISDVIDQKIGELSGGQQQRVSIARVLSKKPKILFADEPTGNLDKQTALLVIDVLVHYTKKENAALFLVTHDDEVAKKCDFHYRLENRSLASV